MQNKVIINEAVIPLKKSNLISNVKNIFFGSSFRKNATLLSSGNIFLLILQTAFYPIVARLYGSEDFGEFAIIQSSTYTLGFLMTLKYEAAILSCEHIEESKKVKQAILTWSFCVVLFFLLLLLILPESLYDDYLAQKYAMLIPVFMLSFSVNQVFRHWFLRIEKIVLFMKFLFVQKLMSMLGTFLLAFVLTTYNGIIAGHLLGVGALLTLLTWYARDDFIFELSTLRSVFVDHIKFLKFLLPSSVLQMGGTHGPFLLTNEWFGSSVTGLLSMAMQVVHLPQNVLFSKLSESLHQRFHGFQVDLAELRICVLKIWRYLFLIMLLPSIALVLWGDVIFSTILGDEWLLSGEMTQYLGLAMFSSAFVGVVYNVFIIIDKQKVLLSLQMVRLAIVLGAFIFAGFKQDILLGVQCFSIGIVIFHGLVCIVVMTFLSSKQNE